MRCPLCEAELVEVEKDGVGLDRCTHCCALFFDAGELDQTLAEPLEKGLRDRARRSTQRPCPRCEALMYVAQTRYGEVLFCRACRGVLVPGQTTVDANLVLAAAPLTDRARAGWDIADAAEVVVDTVDLFDVTDVGEALVQLVMGLLEV